MSARLVQKVLESDLSRRLKPVAIVMAHCALNDGSSSKPGAYRVARWLGRKDVKGVQDDLKELDDLGVLAVMCRSKGGHPTEYRVLEAGLTQQGGMTPCLDIQTGGNSGPEQGVFATDNRGKNHLHRRSVNGSVKPISETARARVDKKSVTGTAAGRVQPKPGKYRNVMRRAV